MHVSVTCFNISGAFESLMAKNIYELGNFSMLDESEDSIRNI